MQAHVAEATERSEGKDGETEDERRDRVVRLGGQRRTLWPPGEPIQEWMDCGRRNRGSRAGMNRPAANAAETHSSTRHGWCARRWPGGESLTRSRERAPRWTGDGLASRHDGANEREVWNVECVTTSVRERHYQWKTKSAFGP